jgi:hypothetical protein
MISMLYVPSNKQRETAVSENVMPCRLVDVYKYPYDPVAIFAISVDHLRPKVIT